MLQVSTLNFIVLAELLYKWFYRYATLTVLVSCIMTENDYPITDMSSRDQVTSINNKILKQQVASLILDVCT